MGENVGDSGKFLTRHPNLFKYRPAPPHLKNFPSMWRCAHRAATSSNESNDRVPQFPRFRGPFLLWPLLSLPCATPCRSAERVSPPWSRVGLCSVCDVPGSAKSTPPQRRQAPCVPCTMHRTTSTASRHGCRSVHRGHAHCLSLPLAHDKLSRASLAPSTQPCTSPCREGWC